MKKYHAFISYASEDLDSFVLPLANRLKSIGLKIWFDRFCLKIGDSIIEKINLGLSESNYGIVVFSKNFFKKKFPKKELNALFNLEIDNKSLILPIWKDISKKDIMKHYPLLADKWAAKSWEGIDSISVQLQEVLDPDKNAICEKLLLDWSKLEQAASLFLKERPISPSPRIVSGAQALSDLITEGYVKDKIANEIITIRDIYNKVFYKGGNYKSLVTNQIIGRLQALINKIEGNIKLRENNLFID